MAANKKTPYVILYWFSFKIILWMLILCGIRHSQNVTDLLQVVNFTDLLQLVNKLQQACQFHQVATSLLKSGLLQFVICNKPVGNKFGQSTCNKSVDNLQQTCRQRAVASHANAS